MDRRGQARLQLKNYKEALEDFEAAKAAEPKTPNVDKNIEAANKGMEEEKNNASNAKEDEEKKVEAKDDEKVEDKGDQNNNNAEEEKKQDDDQKIEKEGSEKTDDDLLKDIEVSKIIVD